MGGCVTSMSVSSSVLAKSLPNVLSPKPADEKSDQSLGELGETGDEGKIDVRFALPFVSALPLPFAWTLGELSELERLRGGRGGRIEGTAGTALEDSAGTKDKRRVVSSVKTRESEG